MRDDIVALLNAAAARYNIAPEILRALAWVESRGNPDAVSSAGAVGVLQLMPATSKAFGVEDPIDPAQNIDAGARFFARLLERFGRHRDALAAYNWGPARVAAGKPWPESVKRYVDNVLAQAAREITPQPTTKGNGKAAPRPTARAPRRSRGSQGPELRHCPSCSCFSLDGGDVRDH